MSGPPGAVAAGADGEAGPAEGPAGLAATVAGPVPAGADTPSGPDPGAGWLPAAPGVPAPGPGDPDPEAADPATPEDANPVMGTTRGTSATASADSARWTPNQETRTASPVPTVHRARRRRVLATPEGYRADIGDSAGSTVRRYGDSAGGRGRSGGA